MSRAEIFRTLGDPTRLRIFALVAREELAVGEVQDIVGLGQSTVSGHLAQLRTAGLVTARRDGKWMHYRLNPQMPLWCFRILEAMRDGAECGGLRT